MFEGGGGGGVVVVYWLAIKQALLGVPASS